MVFFITMLFLIAYGINIVVAIQAFILSDDKDKKKLALFTIFMSILAAIGTLYLASH